MLRCQGEKRTNSHNVKLYSLLGMAGGFVNAAPFLGFPFLNTNVTGYAALFAERIAMRDWKMARVAALWMFLFFADAFISGLVVFQIALGAVITS